MLLYSMPPLLPDQWVVLRECIHGSKKGLEQVNACLSYLTLKARFGAYQTLKSCLKFPDKSSLTARVFYYQENREVIKNISFKVEPGQTIALVGPSGAGKTTLIRLLHRFYDPTQGEIRVDGIPLKNVELSSYWKQIGIVPQETILFGGSIEMNIRYAKDGASKEEIIAAAKAANAHTFIMECPEQYKTVCWGKKVSVSLQDNVNA